ncbi:MAG: glucuronate isomerase, partial [Deltaproteobacteria bacterium]
MLLHPDRLLPVDPESRRIARGLYERVKDLPIISPHGHTDPVWYAEDMAFPDPAQLFVVPDHYIFRMLVSQGISLSDLGVPRVDGGEIEQDPRKIWALFAANYHLFRGTPTRLWVDHALETLFGITERLSADTATRAYDQIAERLADPAFRPRALYKRFNIEVIATTDSALDPLTHHKAIKASGWEGRVIPTYRPDAVVDPEFDGFVANLAAFASDTTWDGYLAAHRARRAEFRSLGATATDHGHVTAQTADLPKGQAEALYAKVRAGQSNAVENELFRAQMLTELARMSAEDGMVMQIHAGSSRGHSAWVKARH